MSRETLEIMKLIDRRYLEAPVYGKRRILSLYGPPEIFNAAQGSQFTSAGFTSVLKAHGVKISMDGRGRFRDNYNTRRLYRSWGTEDRKKST